MTTSIPPTLLSQLVAQHGGMERWRRCEQIEASLSSDGLAFTSHMQPRALLNRRVEVYPHCRHVVLSPYPSNTLVGHWTPDFVYLRDASGEITAERARPRAGFASPKKQMRWDALDLLYFAGYALWNYLTFPFLLVEHGVRVEEGDDGRGDPGRLILCASFPEGFPTHSREQRFEIDADTGLLRRHDYVANVIGRWASAANYCLASQQIEGLRFYTRRRVYPRLGPLVLPCPTLVWIELEDIRVWSSQPARAGAARQGCTRQNGGGHAQ